MLTRVGFARVRSLYKQVGSLLRANEFNMMGNEYSTHLIPQVPQNEKNNNSGNGGSTKPHTEDQRKKKLTKQINQTKQSKILNNKRYIGRAGGRKV